MRELSRTVALVLWAICSAGLSITARAQVPPVIEAEREVGLGFSDQLLNYKEHIDDPNLHDRELGWVPGFDAFGASMFDVGPVKHVFASASFQYDNGSVAYHGVSLSPPFSPIESRSGAIFKDLRLEAGKSFLLGGQVLITPVVQFGYRVWNRDLAPSENEDYSDFFLGLALHADCAVTRRLVLRGRLGWAETLNPGITINLANPDDGFNPGVQASLGTRPLWQVSGGLDYRVYGPIHAYGNADYTRFSYGMSQQVFSPGNGLLLEPNSSTGSLVLKTGFAVGF